MADRRAFLQGLVAASVAIPVRASATVDTDAELIAIGQEWATAERWLEAAWVAIDEAADRYGDGPSPPPELFWQKADPSAFYHCATKHAPSGLQWYGTPNIIERLRGFALNLIPLIAVADGSDRPAVPDLKARARRDEIVASYDHWQADCAAQADACGLTAARATTDTEIDINAAIRLRIINTPARTPAGLLVKARVAAHCHGGIAQMQEDAFGGAPTDEALMCSLVLDLIKMEASDV